MNVLVTGGTGFLGANIVKHLNARGVRPRVLMRKTSDERALEGLEYERAYGDIVEPDSLPPAMKGVEWVFHAAATVAMWRGAWERSHRVNVDGTRHVVEAARKAGVKRLVHTSTISALGLPKDGDQGDESLEWDLPFDFTYNHSKRMAEEEVRKGVREGLEAVILNPGLIFGERDVNRNAGRILLEIRKGKMPVLPPGGGSVCDADEVAKAHIAAAERGAVGERYVVAGNNVTYKEMFDAAAALVGGKAPSFRLPAFVVYHAGKMGDLIASVSKKEPLISFDMAFSGLKKSWFSSQKAIDGLGYRIVPMRESMEKCYRWYLEKGIMEPATGK